jgi:hypothetical protein
MSILTESLVTLFVSLMGFVVFINVLSLVLFVIFKEKKKHKE